MKSLFLILLLAAFCSTTGAVNIPPSAIEGEHFMTGDLWEIQEIPGTSLEAAMTGNTESSWVRLSFPDPQMGGPQKFALHVSGGDDYSTFVAAELFEGGFYIRLLLLSGEQLFEVGAGDDVILYAPWAFDELDDPSGADVEIVISIYGECLNPSCPPNTREPGYLEAVGWRNGFLISR